jgi:hypothetical protein
LLYSSGRFLCFCVFHTSPYSNKYDNLVQQLISNVILFQLTCKGFAQKKGHSVLLRSQRMLVQLVSSFGGTPRVQSSNSHGSEFQAEGKKKSPRSPQAKAQVKRRPFSRVAAPCVWMGRGFGDFLGLCEKTFFLITDSQYRGGGQNPHRPSFA